MAREHEVLATDVERVAYPGLLSPTPTMLGRGLKGFQMAKTYKFQEVGLVLRLSKTLSCQEPGTADGASSAGPGLDEKW